MKNPNWQEAHQLAYTSVAEESKQWFSRTNLVGDECGTWTSNDWGQIPQTDFTRNKNVIGYE